MDFREKHEDIPINAEVWVSYKINDFENNNTKKGWYDAVSDKQIVGEKIEGTNRDKKVLKDFNYLEKQPNEHWFGDTSPGANNLWDSLFEIRTLLEKIKDDVQDKHSKQNAKLSDINKKLVSKRTSQSIRNLIRNIPNVGGEDSFFFKNEITHDLEVPFCLYA